MMYVYIYISVYIYIYIDLHVVLTNLYHVYSYVYLHVVLAKLYYVYSYVYANNPTHGGTRMTCSMVSQQVATYILTRFWTHRISIALWLNPITFVHWLNPHLLLVISPFCFVYPMKWKILVEYQCLRVKSPFFTMFV